MRSTASRLVRVSVVTLCGLAIVCVLLLGNYSKALWLPSLACNFLTTGIAIWIIEDVVAGAETQERERLAQLHEHVGRSVKRQVEAQATSAGPLWIIGASQIMEGLARSREAGMVAREGWSIQFDRLGASLRDTLIIFGRWLDPKLLLELDQLQSSLRAVVKAPQGLLTDLDEHELWLYTDDILQRGESVSTLVGVSFGSEILSEARAWSDRATKRMVASNAITRALPDVRILPPALR